MQDGIKHISGIALFIVISSLVNLMGQDNESPVSPQLTLVTVDPASGFSHLHWTPGGSPDVAAYVIYTYSNNQGEPVDTLFDPLATSYIYTKIFANSYSIDYVIAALDSSDNVSPLSNPLSTIFTSTVLDTCNQKIILDWNLYNDFPFPVLEYSIYVSEDGGSELIAGSTSGITGTFSFEDFETGHTYCFRVVANIEGDIISSSNSTCIETDIIRPPLWINGDYSRVDSDNNIELSFTYDTDSEIELFRLEKADSRHGPFLAVRDIYDNTGNIIIQAGTIDERPLYFRLSAINYCDLAVLASNIITAISTELTINQKEIEIIWSEYFDFNGGISEYNLYRIMNGQRAFIASNSPGDTIYRDHLENFIYQNNVDNICYQVEALENNNPYTINNNSRSQISCIDTPVKIFVPNAFTPDGDLLNETFYPFIPFTPKKYRLYIKTRSGVTVFSTTDFLEQWDGTHGGKALQPDVYLWFIELTTPGGKEINRNGTVTIIFN